MGCLQSWIVYGVIGAGSKSDIRKREMERKEKDTKRCNRSGTFYPNLLFGCSQ